MDYLKLNVMDRTDRNNTYAILKSWFFPGGKAARAQS
jgi:hypothetical protein